MLRLLGIRPNRVFAALGGVAVLVTGLAVHHPYLMALGGLVAAWSAVTLAVSRRR